MKREEKITSLKHLFMGGTSFEEVLKEAMDFADEHHQWISVEDELPMEYEPVLAAFGNHYARVCFYSGGKWYIDAGVISDEVFGVSHWMQISPPQVTTCSEFPNNSKKGGNQ